jgi:hypothetical protein
MDIGCKDVIWNYDITFLEIGVGVGVILLATYNLLIGNYSRMEHFHNKNYI